MLNFFVDYIHNEVVKPYTDKFLKLDPRSIEAELILSTWLREQACDGILSPLVALYLQNELIQFKLAENVKIVILTLSALNTTNINLSGFLERSIAPMTMVAMNKLLQERLQKLDAPEKAQQKP